MMVHVMLMALLFTFPINNYVKAFNLAFHQVMKAQKRSFSIEAVSLLWTAFHEYMSKAGDNEVVEWAPLTNDFGAGGGE